MNNRIKNICILAILIIFLLIVELIPVTCLFKHVTGISCPACGMTRAFHSILHLDLFSAFGYNILSIPLFFFIVISSLILAYEILTNKFNYISKLLKLLSNKYILVLIFIMLTISFIANNTIHSF